MTHNLSNKRKYLHYYQYIASEAINIFSDYLIKEGDKVKIDSEVYVLETNDEHTGRPMRSEYRGKQTNYYQFKINQIK